MKLRHRGRRQRQCVGLRQEVNRTTGMCLTERCDQDREEGAQEEQGE